MKKGLMYVFAITLIFNILTIMTFADSTLEKNTSTYDSSTTSKATTTTTENKTEDKTSTEDNGIGGIEIKIDEETSKTLFDKANKFIGPIAAILVFAAIVLVGIEIIMKRNKADERMQSMSSLLWIAIGAMVIGGSGLIYSMLINGSSNTTENIKVNKKENLSKNDIATKQKNVEEEAKKKDEEKNNTVQDPVTLLNQEQISDPSFGNNSNTNINEETKK